MKESRNPATEERFVVRELGEEPQVIARELPFVSSKACLPIVVTLAGITSVPPRSVSEKAHPAISTSAVASDRSKLVSLVSSKA
eukprot:scaffold9092_cov24-Phaeocystis_antarctica.AAC.1